MPACLQCVLFIQCIVVRALAQEVSDGADTPMKVRILGSDFTNNEELTVS